MQKINTGEKYQINIWRENITTVSTIFLYITNVFKIFKKKTFREDICSEINL